MQPPTSFGKGKESRTPSNFVLAIAKVESGLLPHRVSSAGAMGVMQLMPEQPRCTKSPIPLVLPTQSMVGRECSQIYGSAIEVTAAESPPRTTLARGVYVRTT